MAWHSTAPVGTISVKANRIILQDNTTYIETTMGNSVVGTNTNTTRDHFWNVGANEDGRHRFINSPKFTVGGVAADPVIGTGMDGVLYLRQCSTSLTRIEGFYRNVEGIFQYIPAYDTGTHVVTGSYTNMIAVPANCWGEIYMWTDAAGNRSGQSGFFKSNGATVDAWAYGERVQGSSTAGFPLNFGNGSDASGLNIRVRTEGASSGQTWNYRIMYRSI